jgi:cysteine desulfurase
MARNYSSSARPIYLDHHATTPVEPRVLKVMLPFFSERFGNAASIDHIYGNEAAQAVEEAREKVAKVINARPDEIIFTSGATEANNLAIIGIAERYIEKGRHIISCVTEHKAVLDTCNYLETKGYKVTYIHVDKHGIIELDELKNAINANTILISVMTANNEIGTIAPLAEIGSLAKQHGILFHTDAAQAFGHIPLNVEDMGVDLMSISGHKIYGPKGIGALYVRRLHPRVKLATQMHGGGHERGMRSGTLNVPGAVGLGAASAIAQKEMLLESDRLMKLRNYLWKELTTRIEDIELNGHPTNRLSHNLNICIPGVENRALLVKLKHIASFSAGSACTSNDLRPSHVLLALGYDEERSHSSVRFGLGRSIKYRSDLPVDAIVTAITELRQLGGL